MRVAIVTFPGSNGTEDAAHAVAEVLGARTWSVWHTATSLEVGAGQPDAVIVPGGYSYGDYLRGGALAARSPVMDALRRYAASGGPILGICNGFQVLTEAGLLPGQLGRNSSTRFVCRNVTVRVERTDLAFTRSATPGQLLRLPVAHADGRYYLPPVELERLEGEGNVVFRYVGPDGEESDLANPNGSVNGIAGVVNDAGNVLGMMPHPERAVEALLGSEDGRVVLSSLLNV